MELSRISCPRRRRHRPIRMSSPRPFRFLPLVARWMSTKIQRRPASLVHPRCPRLAGKCRLPSRRSLCIVHDHPKQQRRRVPRRPTTPLSSNLEERPLPDWAIPDHVPDFVVRRDPREPSPAAGTLPYKPVSDVEIMETFKDPRLVKSRLEDSPPEVFDNPAYHISPTGKWLQKLAEGDCSVARPERKRFVPTPLRLPEAGDESLTFAEYQVVSDRNSKLRAQHDAQEMARFRQLEADNLAALKTWESRANDYRRNLPIIRARQVEVLESYQADRERIIDRIERQANTIGEYAYFLAKHALPRSGSGRGVSSRVAAASGEPVPLIAVPPKRGLAEINDVELPPIAAISEDDRDSGEERPPEVSRTGAPSKGKAKATSSTSDRELREGSVANTSHIAPGAALSAKPEPSSAGSFLGTRPSGAGPNAGEGGSSSTGAGPSSTQQGQCFDVDAWHKAHNPFSGPPFQQDLVLNANGTKAVVSHSWQLDPVNPCFLARLAPYGVLASQMPSWAVTSRAKGCKECHENGAACVRLVQSGAPPVTSCQRLPHEKPDLRRVVLWIRLYADRPRYFHHEHRARRHCIVKTRGFGRDVLLVRICRRLGRPWSVASTFSFAREPDASSSSSGPSFLSKARNTATATIASPLPVIQDPSDAATFLTHILEDVVERISAGARDMGGSFGQRVSQAFLPDRRVELPGGFEAGDRPLDLAGVHRRRRRSTTSAAPANPAVRLRIVPFPFDVPLRWRGSPALSLREVSTPSEDDSAREDDSTREDDTAGEGAPLASRRSQASGVQGSSAALDSRAASFETNPYHPPQAGGSLFGRTKGGYAWDVAPSANRYRYVYRQASSPGRAASVDEGSAGSLRELETGDANDANGASGGSIESGGTVAVHRRGRGVEDVDME
ncbi:hypothetical protein B0H14DRAFT_2657832 [Mycena olivaceomarginata]|nr:hypothetical protein B0H14DRAFT_2657832 [Mycena olivaceomarginata]